MSEATLAELCGGRVDLATQAAIAFWKALWVAAMNRNGATCEAASRSSLVLNSATVKDALWSGLNRSDSQLPQAKFGEIISLLLGKARKEENSEWLEVPDAWFCAFDACKAIVGEDANSEDLEYFTSRELRRRNKVVLGASMMRSFRTYIARLDAWLENPQEPRIQNYALFLLMLQRGKDKLRQEDVPADSFFELVSATGWVQPASGGDVKIDLARFNVETLTNRYFSVPIAIPGFNSIFGGWGPLLIDVPGSAGGEMEIAIPIGARTILTTGPYGTGKSTLTLQMAIDVARKGGAAIVVAMEQSVEECLFAMEALGVSTLSEQFQTVFRMGEAMPLFSQKYDGKGLLAFLPVRSTGGGPETNFEEVLETLTKRLSWLVRFPLRLLIIDPINSVLDENLQDSLKWRQELQRLFDAAKRQAVNIWITSERNPGLNHSSFEENIADTVLYLGVNRAEAIQRRTIKVAKSRLQREESGSHSMEIQPRQGIRIYPSSISIAKATSQERLGQANAGSLMVEGLDRILGYGAILRGDVIALDGAPGSSRTMVGVHFLFGRDNVEAGSGSTSLFVSDSNAARLDSLIDLVEKQLKDKNKTRADIRFCPILVGAVEPSQILQSIKDHFEDARRQNRPIDRVMVSDLSRWELSMPLMKEDPAFGPALLGLLRHWGATSVLLADYVSGNQGSLLTDLIVNNADCVFQFEKLEFRGQTRQLVRVTKSRTMNHRRDAFELIVNRGAARIESYGALLRKDKSGNVHPVRIRLFLHADSPHHQEFNDRLIGAIKTSLSEAEMGDEWGRYDPEIFRLTASSAVDEIQVMQLDEFQLPSALDPDRDEQFFAFTPGQDTSNEDAYAPDQYLERLAKRIRGVAGEVIALPFYENISLLAHHGKRLQKAAEAGIPEDLAKTIKAEDIRDKEGNIDLSRVKPDYQAWELLRYWAVKWDEQGENRIFFSCPLAQKDTVETYNCLFFEMLQSYSGPPPASECKLAEWLKDEKAKKAAHAFRDLCYRSHRYEQGFFRSPPGGLRNGRKAADPRTLRTFEASSDFYETGPVVWRHWYNTLSQMMWDLCDEERSQIRVHPLFGDVTTAGEWYLVVPAYSAAPELARQIIHMITAPDRELQRIYRGVGLPTRKSYYSQSEQLIPVSPVSPFFHLQRTKLQELVNRAFQRSMFPCYRQFSETISAHLQRILELPPQPWEPMHQQINLIVDHLSESIQYIQQTAVCRVCKSKNAGLEFAQIQNHS